MPSKSHAVHGWPNKTAQSFAGAGTLHEVSVAHRLVADGELEDAVEDQPSAMRSASVESERKLVRVCPDPCQRFHAREKGLV